MEKSNRILVAIIAILLIVLSIITYMYFDMRGTAKKNMEDYIRASKIIERWNLEYTEQVDM